MKDCWGRVECWNDVALTQALEMALPSKCSVTYRGFCLGCCWAELLGCWVGDWVVGCVYERAVKRRHGIHSETFPENALKLYHTSPSTTFVEFLRYCKRLLL